MKLGDLGMAVNHNSPYLLKKADGSFIDPETGERLGFDHRFMGKGEGNQAHGWGSYFSENDLRLYAETNNSPKYEFASSLAAKKFNNDNLAFAAISSVVDAIRDDNLGKTPKQIIDEEISFWRESIKSAKEAIKIGQSIDPAELDNTNEQEIRAKWLNRDREAMVSRIAILSQMKTTHKPAAQIIEEGIKNYEAGIKADEKVIAILSELDSDDFEKDGLLYRHHYTVEIPDNDGTNYIEEEKPITDVQAKMVLKQLKKEVKKGADYLETWFYYLYDDEEEKPIGKYLYADLKTEFKTPENVSKFLHRCGFAGIHYTGFYRDGSCYVIFDENDAKIVNHELFGLSGDAPRFNVGDWIEYFPLVAEAKRGKYKGKLWVHNITAVGDTFYTVDSWCVQTHQPHRNRQMTISGQQEWYRKIAQPQWATDHDRRLRLAKAKAKALKLKLELMKIEGINEKNAEIHSRNNRVKLGDTNKRSAIMENNIIFADILSEAEKLYKYGLQVFGTDWLRTLLPERITQEAKRGLYGIANKNAAALFIARRCEAASAAQRGVVADRPTLQGDVIIEAFAKEHDFWIENTDSYFHSKFGQPMSYGSEATIYCDRQRRMVVKTIDTELYDNNVSKAIYRFLIHNILFPETWFNIVAFGRSQYGLFEIIVEQDYIDGEFATIRQFEEKLASIGLVKNKGDWENELFFVSDVKSKNAIVDEDGNVFVIDCYLELKEQNQ